MFDLLSISCPASAFTPAFLHQVNPEFDTEIENEFFLDYFI
jgi:hypothetical protein